MFPKPSSLMTILIVDDDKHACRILKTLLDKEPSLAKCGLTVKVAGDGRAGLLVLDEGPVHLVISDLLMPGMDGFTFCRELRRRPDGESVPLIVTSAVYKDPITIRKLKVEVGAEFFTKPYQFADLLGAVRRLLGIEKPEPIARVASSASRPKRETKPTPTRPRTIPAQGSLRQHPIGSLLFELSQARASCCLVIGRGPKTTQNIARIHLFHGNVVACDSSSRQEALGVFLRERGVLSEAQLIEALEIVHNEGQLIGQVVLAKGWLTEERLLHLMEEQMRTRLFAVMRWDDATFSIEEPSPPYERITLTCQTADLIAAAVQRTPPSASKEPLPPKDERHRKLLAEYLAADGKTYYELLGVERNATPKVLQSAYEAALLKMAPERFSDLDLGPDYGKISELRERYQRAFAVLSSRAHRQNYDETLLSRMSTGPKGAKVFVTAELLYRKALSLLSSGALKEAVGLLEQAGTLCNDQPDYLAALGWARFLLCRHEQQEQGEAGVAAAARDAQPALLSALAIEPRHMDARVYLGHIHVALHQDGEAAAYFESVLEDHPLRKDLVLSLDRALCRIGALKRLRGFYERLILNLEPLPKTKDLDTYIGETKARLKELTLTPATGSG